MNRSQADVNDTARTIELVNIVLRGVSDEQLLAEVRRRGLTLNDGLSEE